MVVTIVSHVTAALMPIVLYLAGRQMVTVRRLRHEQKQFWAAQGRSALERFSLIDDNSPPPALPVVHEHVMRQGTVQALAVCRELGLFAYLEKSPGATGEAIARFVDLPLETVEPVLTVLQAAGALTRHGSGFAVTLAARMYVDETSPFVDYAIPAKRLAATVKRVIKSGMLRRSSQRWALGKPHKSEQWAVGAHGMSFPLGFALDSSGLLKGATRILDVAGGIGSVCVALAVRDARRRLTLLDLPASIALARRMLTSYQVSEQVECKALDMFSGVWPDGQDALLFTNVLHDWDLGRCRTLLGKAREALRPGGRVVIQEALLNDDEPGPIHTAFLSLLVHLHTSGKQFQRREITALLQEMGFVDVQIHPLHHYYSSIVAIRPESA